MGLSLKSVQRIKELFKRAYVRATPYAAYEIECGISRVGINDPGVPEDEKDDLCIVARMQRPLPKELSLPAKFHGIRIFSKVCGKVRPRR